MTKNPDPGSTAGDPFGDLVSLVASVINLSPTEREAAIAQFCRNHPSEDVGELRRAVDEAIASTHHMHGRAMSASTMPIIAGYKMLHHLGDGGMGSVYLAERAGLSQRVAVKVIKLGMDTKSVLARFEVERAALSRMEHSHIAKVFDSDVSADGRPYFVMEYVKGIPITRYCDENRLAVEERLALFLQMCSGVQHAHNKGVIHRDLTPNNVLVSVQDGRAAVKIIDFGLARATEHRLTDKTLFTEQGVILGTPEYMSPEQAGLGGLDVDTRSDVYTLGVVLHELLVGSLPFGRDELRAAGYDGMCRIIREKEPERPSTKITRAQSESAAIAMRRRTGSDKLLRRLRGDLDWIVLRCLEKDRTRRYDTPSALAADLQRHLDDEPVDARPPSFGYRLKKLGRRYRGQLVAAALVFFAVVGGLVGTTAFWLDARTQAREAKRQEGIAEQKATEALARKAEFDQVAAVVQVENALATERELYPSWPEKVPAMKQWLASVARLVAMRPQIETTLASLRERAVQRTPEEAERPEDVEYRRLAAKLAALERAAAVRTGDAEVVELALTPEEQAMPPEQLNEIAWPRVAPDEQMRIWGEEPRALALAHLAWEKGKDVNRTLRFKICTTLAWAWFANGCDALARSQMELGRTPDRRYVGGDAVLLDLAAATAEAKTTLASLRDEVARLAVARTARLFHFADDDPLRFLHTTLSNSLSQLITLAALERRVAGELAWAELMRALTLSHPNARQSWQAAREAILKADGVGASTLYREQPIDLSPQPGLIPLGMNPVTKLWEFYDLRSAWDGMSDPAGIEIPQHVLVGDKAGHLEVGDGSGIVFVLLPGGVSTMGEQRDDPKAPNYDPHGLGGTRSVTLSPFLLARHELTCGQWQRLSSGEIPALRRRRPERQRVQASNPVTGIDWFQTERLFTRHGMVMPTEAQWERGCRAGSTKPLFCDPASLADYVNFDPELGDEEKVMQYLRLAIRGYRPRQIMRVGMLRPNSFGLYDVLGNASEWTADGCDESRGRLRSFRSGDGLQGDPADFDFRVTRGGDVRTPTNRFTCTLHEERHPFLGYRNLGVRAGRNLRP